MPYTSIQKVFEPKEQPDVFTYLEYMVNHFDIISFTLVPFVPAHYTRDGIISEEDYFIPKPQVISVKRYPGDDGEHDEDDWKGQVNKFFREYDVDVTEIGLSSRVETIDGPRHMLMLDLDGRGYPGLQAIQMVDDVMYTGIDLVERDKFVSAKSERSYHLYYYGGLFTDVAWRNLLASCLLPNPFAPVVTDVRWIGNVLFHRGYGIIRISHNTVKYTHAPVLITDDSKELLPYWTPLPEEEKKEDDNPFDISFQV